MNPCLRNLNRIEFVITYACTGRCRHCSEGEHTGRNGHIDSAAAAEVVRRVCGRYKIESLMTFGGEPLLYPETVCAIHAAAKEENIPKRSLITNGFFDRNTDRIADTAAGLARSGVNDILLSVDAFHQETIPLEPVKLFAEAAIAQGIPLRVNPAWLTNANAENPYNQKTLKIVREFERMGIPCSAGNVIFPAGNALKYLSEYFDADSQPANVYEENPEDMHTISISPNGDTLGGNVYQTNILEIMEHYMPGECEN